MNRTEHLLIILAEECAELQIATTKTLRFGKDDGYPGGNQTNEQDMRQELNELLAVVGFLQQEGFDLENDPSIRQKKESRIETYLVYSKSQGTLD